MSFRLDSAIHFCWPTTLFSLPGLSFGYRILSQARQLSLYSPRSNQTQIHKQNPTVVATAICANTAKENVLEGQAELKRGEVMHHFNGSVCTKSTRYDLHIVMGHARPYTTEHHRRDIQSR